MDVYLCECSDRRCSDPITLTRREYEAARALPIRFAIVVNHENPEIDRVLVENERFATIEKFYGAGARIARATNPLDEPRRLLSGASGISQPGPPLQQREWTSGRLGARRCAKAA